MHCANCGKISAIENKYCVKCGTRFSHEDRINSIQIHNDADELETYQKSVANKIVITSIISSSLTLIGSLLTLGAEGFLLYVLFFLLTTGFLLTYGLLLKNVFVRSKSESTLEYIKLLNKIKGLSILALIIVIMFGSKLELIGIIPAITLSTKAEKAYLNWLTETENITRAEQNLIIAEPETFPDEKWFPISNYYPNTEFQLVSAGISRLGEYPTPYIRFKPVFFKHKSVKQLKINYELYSQEGNCIYSDKDAPCILTISKSSSLFKAIPFPFADSMIDDMQTIKVIIAEIIHENGVVEAPGEYINIDVPYDRLMQIRESLGEDAVCKHAIKSSKWICCCGHENDKESSYCARCARQNIMHLNDDGSLKRRYRNWEDVLNTAYSSESTEEWLNKLLAERAYYSTLDGFDAFLDNMRIGIKNERLYGSFKSSLIKDVKKIMEGVSSNN